MATRAEIERDRRALNALVTRAQGALGKVLARMPSAEQIATMSDSGVVDLYKIIRERWWMVADQYGTMAAALGQSQASMMLADAGYPSPRLSAAPNGLPDGSGAAYTFISALSQDNWQDALTRGLDGTIKTANTWAISDVVEESGASLIWRPFGETCRYCLERASHGAYGHFRSEAQALGFATRPHDMCNCRPEVIPLDGTWPEGYDPARYQQQVAAIDRDRRENDQIRRSAGWATPGPKTRENAKRDMSARAWADRQRIKGERDAAKKRLARAEAKGDTDAIASARDVLDRTAAERAALNGTT